MTLDAYLRQIAAKIARQHAEAHAEQLRLIVKSWPRPQSEKKKERGN